jgi:hypothetical protein
MISQLNTRKSRPACFQMETSNISGVGLPPKDSKLFFLFCLFDRQVPVLHCSALLGNTECLNWAISLIVQLPPCPMADLHYNLFWTLHYTICCTAHWWMVFNYQASHLVVFFCVDSHCDLFPDCVATFLTAVQWLTSCPLSPLCGGQTELCRILNSFQCCVPNPMKCNSSDPSLPLLSFSPLLFLPLLPYFNKPPQTFSSPDKSIV